MGKIPTIFFVRLQRVETAENNNVHNFYETKKKRSAFGVHIHVVTHSEFWGSVNLTDWTFLWYDATALCIRFLIFREKLVVSYLTDYC